MSSPERQLALLFPHAPIYGPDFLAAASNADALAWLRNVEDWPQGRLALWGGPDSGKTHLLRLWSGRVGGRLLAGRDLTLDAPRSPLAIDDADQAPPLELLHTLNAAAEARLPVLLVGRTPPSRWPVTLADLASRLRAVTAVEIAAHEDSLLRSLFAKQLAERQLVVAEPLQEWMLLRLPRTAGAIREAAARLDQTGQRPTRTLAAAVVASFASAEAPKPSESVETGRAK